MKRNTIFLSAIASHTGRRRDCGGGVCGWGTPSVLSDENRRQRAGEDRAGAAVRYRRRLRQHGASA